MKCFVVRICRLFFPQVSSEGDERTVLLTDLFIISLTSWRGIREGWNLAKYFSCKTSLNTTWQERKN